MSITKKEIRNIDVRDMEIDVREIISSNDKASKESLDEIDSIYKRHLKSIQCTGEPDNLKEIRELVHSWDFRRVVLRKQYFINGKKYVKTSRSIYYHTDCFVFYVDEYIKNGDWIREAYGDININEKILIIDIDTDEEYGKGVIYEFWR
jgi:hypothetical protein